MKNEDQMRNTDRAACMAAVLSVMSELGNRCIREDRISEFSGMPAAMVTAVLRDLEREGLAACSAIRTWQLTAHGLARVGRPGLARDEEAAVALRPCPFCGGRAEPTRCVRDVFGWEVRCEACTARGPAAQSEVGAIRQWQNRPQPTWG